MTATPIPRTLAQSVYADLDVSIIDEMPPGRTPIETFAMRASRLERAYEFVRKNVAARAASVHRRAGDRRRRERARRSVDRRSGAAANATFSRSARRACCTADCRRARKTTVMGRFARGEIDVLVATTVVEVGVDVANASVMVDARRASLRPRAAASAARPRRPRRREVVLHARLPRRCGGDRAARAFSPNRPTVSRSPKRTCDMRGAGEFAGTVQAGAADLCIADLVRDIEIYRAAKARGRADRCRRPGTCAAPSTRPAARFWSAGPTRALFFPHREAGPSPRKAAACVI